VCALALRFTAFFGCGQRQIAPPPARANYCSASDFLVLEDESGRIPLRGLGSLVSHLVSGAWGEGTRALVEFGAHCRFRATAGVVLAVKGTVTEAGELTVKDIRTCRPALAPLPSLAVESGAMCVYCRVGVYASVIHSIFVVSGHPLVMLVSGLNFGGSEFNPLATELLAEFVTGNAGTLKVSFSPRKCSLGITMID
jgi:hypothetical protein